MTVKCPTKQLKYLFILPHTEKDIKVWRRQFQIKFSFFPYQKKIQRPTYFRQCEQTIFGKRTEGA